MHEHLNDGPFYSPGLFGPTGKLTRLHKGGSLKVDPIPPPVRESNREVAAAGETERAAAANRNGYASTLEPKRSKSLMSAPANYDQLGSRSLL